MGIGNIGWTEFIVIVAIALVFFGPRRLPEIASQLGRSLRQFRKAMNEVKSEIIQAGDESTRIHPGQLDPMPEILEALGEAPDRVADPGMPKPESKAKDAKPGDSNAAAD